MCGMGALLGVQAADGVASSRASVVGASTRAVGPGRLRVGSAPAIPHGARRLGALPATRALRLTVALTPQDPAALQTYAQAVSTPGSADFHHYLSVDGFAQRFGAGASQIAAVQSSLRSQGLSVGAPTANHLTLPVKGSVADVEQAFSVTESQLQLPSGRTVYANDQAPQVAASVASSVQAVIGLDDVALPAPQGLTQQQQSDSASVGSPPPSPGSGPTPCTTAASTSGGAGNVAYTADEIANAYGLNGYYAKGDEGQNQTVAFLEQEPLQLSDITAYQQCYNLPATSPQIINVDGGPGTYGTGSHDDEAALDIEQVMGLAPQASIDVYESPPNTQAEADILTRMADDDSAQVISSSWGVCEANAAFMSAENATLQEMAAQGQSFFVASGDYGSTDCYALDQSDKSLSVLDPASQPYATSVGGTSLGVWNSQSESWSANTMTAYPGEYLWNNGPPTGGGSGNVAGSGGGVSANWPMPAYQLDSSPGLGVIQADSSTGCGGQYCREVPDVSADADPNTGYVMYANGGHRGGGWEVLGGTSAAAPLWAAFATLANASADCAGTTLGFVNPVLYELAGAGTATYSADFHDITSTQASPFSGIAGNDVFAGTNTLNPKGLYPVLDGYDMATGLGTPIVNTLGSSLCSPPTPVISVSPASNRSGTVGQPVSVQMQATDSAGDVPRFSATGLPNGLSINPVTGVISGTPATAQTATVTVIAADPITARSVTFTWTIAPVATTTTTTTTTTATVTATTPPPPATTVVHTTPQPPVSTPKPPPPTTRGGPPSPGPPTIKLVALTGLAAGKPRLSFATAAGSHAPKLASVTVTLPGGLRFVKSNRTLSRSITVRSGATRIHFKLRRIGGSVQLTFVPAVSSARVTFGGKAMSVSAGVAVKVHRHQVRQMTMRMAATDAARRTTRFVIAVKKLS